jgi:hypothetical protein
MKWCGISGNDHKLFIFVGFDHASFIDLIEVNQQDDTFDGIYLYYATLHVSGICPSSGVYKEITICVMSVYRLYLGERARLQFYRGCG